jgi:hypothetical protein
MHIVIFSLIYDANPHINTTYHRNTNALSVMHTQFNFYYMVINGGVNYKKNKSNLYWRCQT